MADSLDRKPSLTGEESDWDVIQVWQEEALIPLREDITEWLNKTLGCDITVDNLLQSLDSGIHLCKLTAIIQDKASQSSHQVIKKNKVKFKESAQSGSWFARDNIANFLQWCRQNDVKEECLFETEDLVSHKNEKCVLLCLLELARLGMKVGIEPPGLIALEREIEQEQQQKHNGSGDQTDNSLLSGDKVKEKPAKPKQGPVKKGDKLDTEVMRMTMGCKCASHFQVERLSPGHYIIGGKNMFVRLLKGKHIMVRVGGGWDTLEHYLATHDPCRIMQFRRDGNIAKSNKNGDYAHAKGRYKSAAGNRKTPSVS